MDPRRKWLPVLAVVAAAALIGLGSWWNGWAKRTLEGFVGDLAAGRIAAAHHRLASPSALELLDDGSVRVVDSDGRATVLPPGASFMASGGASTLGLPRRVRDVLTARLAGEVAAVVPGPSSSVVVLHLSCERDEVAIDAVTQP